ncbi:hypothetical protein SNEBB_008303 [Seison nebaliae]|nr:hypothetical protein SNEBB_008303 [Seison nebaliae]
MYIKLLTFLAVIATISAVPRWYTTPKYHGTYKPFPIHTVVPTHRPSGIWSWLGKRAVKLDERFWNPNPWSGKTLPPWVMS